MLAPIGSIRCPLLIGRDDLLELVDRRLADVAAGHGQFLLLAGEAGIGKTRLLEAIHRRAAGQGMPVAIGSVAPQDRDVPAASILDLARTMSRRAGVRDGGDRAPGARGCDDARPASDDAGWSWRRSTCSSMPCPVRPCSGSRTSSGPTTSASRSSASWRAVGVRTRCSIVADYRIEESRRGRACATGGSACITQRIAEEVRLRPLTRDETALATSLILDTGLPASREVAAAVYQRTDGIPLHIEELLGALSAEARADGSAIRDAQVPETIDDAVLARMAHRSKEAQATARAGAVIGRCFAPDVLAGIMDLPVESLEAPLQELVDHMVLAPMANGYFDYRHQLLRDVLYRTIPTSERRRFHARAGEFGATLEGATEIHASVHYERAGLRRQAFDAAVAGAREASLMYAHRESFELYRRAIANVPDDLSIDRARRPLRGLFGRGRRHRRQRGRGGGVAPGHGRPTARLASRARRSSSARRSRSSGVAKLVRSRTGPGIWTSSRPSSEALPPGPDRDAAAAWIAEDRGMLELNSMDLAAARRRIERARADAIQGGDQETILGRRRQPGDAGGPRGALR